MKTSLKRHLVIVQKIYLLFGSSFHEFNKKCLKLDKISEETINAFLDFYLKEHQLKKQTIYQYRNILRRFANYINMKINRLNTPKKIYYKLKGGGWELARVVRARYEKGVLRPLEALDLREGEEVVIELREDILEFARRIRKQIRIEEEPSETLSKERERFE